MAINNSKTITKGTTICGVTFRRLKNYPCEKMINSGSEGDRWASLLYVVCLPGDPVERSNVSPVSRYAWFCGRFPWRTNTRRVFCDHHSNISLLLRVSTQISRKVQILTPKNGHDASWSLFLVFLIHKETKEMNVQRVFGNQMKLLFFASLISPYKIAYF